MKSKYPNPNEIARRIIIEQAGGPQNLTPSQIMSQVVFHSQSQAGACITPGMMAKMDIKQIAALIGAWCTKNGIPQDLQQAAIAYAGKFWADAGWPEV